MTILYEGGCHGATLQRINAVSLPMVSACLLS